MSDCLFCRIVAGEIPSDCLFSDDDLYAFRDVKPCAPHHILIIPKKHITSLAHLETDDEAIMGKLLLRASRIAEQENFASNGYRCVINTGDDGGQTVSHLHLHIVAGRQMTWPPG